MNKLQKYREKNNFTFQDMADFLNISKTYYWQLEKSKRRLSYTMAIKISDIFNLKPDDLFYENFKSKYL
ncbi:MAG: helix-turn-helix transcriptional regulator [Bacilli bacterium]|nr:helix-turn-helix transcriptional regulator [Bacilli bacterium]MDD4283001.1 helix-turn-helix transcriptional regulator [Bacilli bacterium]MDD4718926.1 helix-turn-helix transcriptional regulator [Bacilli bacterium]